MPMVKYPAILDGEQGAYGVVVLDMPGACCAMGETVDEALENAAASLADFVDLLKERGRAVPDPRPIESIVLEPGQMLAYVPLRTALPA